MTERQMAPTGGAEVPPRREALPAEAALAWQNYLEVRDWMLSLASDERTSDDVGLAAASPLLDLAPASIASLRQLGCRVSVLGASGYPGGDAVDTPVLATKHAMLKTVAGGRDLLVPEARILGGFGEEIDGDLVNPETLDFWETMIALEKAAVLKGLRMAPRAGGRRVLWFVGGGWGGLVRAVKTLVPDTVIAVFDRPERFLLSATYLGAVFPGARLYLHDQNSGEADWSADFLFFPLVRPHRVTPPRLDLVLLAEPAQDLTPDLLRGLVDRIWWLGVPYVYRLGRGNKGEETAAGILTERFWPHRVPVLDLAPGELPMPGATQRTTKARGKRRTRSGNWADGTLSGGPRAGHFVFWRKSGG